MRERRTRKDMVLIVGLGIFLISPGELRFTPQPDRAVAVETKAEPAPTPPVRTARND